MNPKPAPAKKGQARPHQPSVQSLTQPLADSLAKAERAGHLKQAAATLNPGPLTKALHHWRAQRPDLPEREQAELDSWLAREFAAELLAIQRKGGNPPNLQWRELAEFANLFEAPKGPRPPRTATKLPKPRLRSGLTVLRNGVAVTIGGSRLESSPPYPH